MIVKLIRAIPLIRMTATGRLQSTVVYPVGAKCELLNVDDRNAAFVYARLIDFGDTVLKLSIGYHIRETSALEHLAHALDDTPYPGASIER